MAGAVECGRDLNITLLSWCWAWLDVSVSGFVSWLYDVWLAPHLCQLDYEATMSKTSLAHSKLKSLAPWNGLCLP